MQEGLPLLATNTSLLKIRLDRAGRRRKARALFLVLPLALFVTGLFLLPIAAMLGRSFYNPDVALILPRATSALEIWNGRDLPDPPIWAALAEDLRRARAGGTIGKVGTIL